MLQIQVDEDQLLDRVARMIAHEAEYQDSEGEWHSRASTLAAKVQKLVVDRVKVAVDAAIKAEVNDAIKRVTEAHITEAVSAVLAEGWQKTDEYGTPKGPRMGLKDRIVEFMTAKDGYYSDQKRRIDKLVEDSVKAAFDAEFKKEIEAAKTKFRELLDNSIQTKFAEAVKAGLGLK